MIELHFVSATDVGIVRDHNEDAVGDPLICNALIPPNALQTHGHLFAVADGMGGHEGGEVASALAISTLFRTFYHGPEDVHDGLLAAFEAANKAVFAAARERVAKRIPELAHSPDPALLMGTTLVAVAVGDQRAIVANIGDSRAYILHNDALQQITADHSLVAEQLRRGTITQAEAAHAKYRNVLLRAVGHAPKVPSDFFELHIGDGDLLLLSSDGLHGVVDDHEIRRILMMHQDIREAARQLIGRANDLGGPDNISVVIAKAAASR